MSEFLKTLKKSIVDAYERLGLVVLSSLIIGSITLILVSALVSLGRFTSLIPLIGLPLYCIFGLPPLIAGEFYLARKIVTRDDPSISDLIRGAKLHLSGSWALGLVQTVITLVCLGNLWFYWTHGGMPLKVVGGFFLYLALFWFASMVYHYPLLIEQNPGTLKILKKAFLLSLDNVAFTAGVFFAIILLTCLCALPLVGVLLLYPGVASIISTRALRVVFCKYGLLEPEPQYLVDCEDPSDDDAVSEAASAVKTLYDAAAGRRGTRWP